MKNMKRILFITMLLLAKLIINAQQVTNVRFDQNGKKINIYYDLKGDKNYTVNIYCSQDEGNTWERPLQCVSGAVGDNQIAGNNKMIVWDVLMEREKLTGNIEFKIEAISPGFTGKSGTFTDPRDGQDYKWIRIGEQVWMAENVNYKTANSWCYGNDSANCRIYGRLYDWLTALWICPEGWHLPSDKEWGVLIKHLGGASVAGGKLKEAGFIHWAPPNIGATNSSGFSALPGGYRKSNGEFSGLKRNGRFWSATESNPANGRRCYLGYDYEDIFNYQNSKRYGFSARCLKD